MYPGGPGGWGGHGSSGDPFDTSCSGQQFGQRQGQERPGALVGGFLLDPADVGGIGVGSAGRAQAAPRNRVELFEPDDRGAGDVVGRR